MHHLHLISDSTGETLNAAAKAALSAFPDDKVEIELHQHVFVRSAADLAAALKSVSAAPGLVFYTLVAPGAREELASRCAALGIEAVPLIDPLISALSQHLGRTAMPRPGRQHQVDGDYFARIAALDFAMAHDDGNLGTRFARADVILAGVSRTSKTPTCIYLAYRGVKAANVPLIPGQQPARPFLDAIASGRLVIGLTASPTRLAQIRTERLEVLGGVDAPDYAELDAIRQEVADARMFFDQHDIPVIDVTRRSIEETAASILQLMRARPNRQTES